MTTESTSENESIEERLFRVGSVLSAVLALAAFVYLYTVAETFSRTPRIFPMVVIQLGLVAAVALVVKEVVVRFVKPDLFDEGDDAVMEHLTGAGSLYALPDRVKRLGIVGAWTVVFFLVATVNVLAALVVSYVGAAYSLGIRDKRTLAASTITLFLFVYVVFVLLIRMPLDLF